MEGTNFEKGFGEATTNMKNNLNTFESALEEESTNNGQHENLALDFFGEQWTNIWPERAYVGEPTDEDEEMGHPADAGDQLAVLDPSSTLDLQPHEAGEIVPFEPADGFQNEPLAHRVVARGVHGSSVRTLESLVKRCHENFGSS